MHARTDIGLLRRPESGPDDHPVGSQHQGSGKPAPISNSPGRTKKAPRAFGRNQVGDLRHKRERRTALTVAPRLGSLSDDHVRPAGKRVLGIVPRLHLAHEQAAGAFYGMGERLRITEGEKNRARPVLQDLIQKLRTTRERPRNEATAYGCVPGGAKLIRQPPRIAVTSADESKIVYGTLKLTLGIRLTPDQERRGADLSIHNIGANPEAELHA